VVKHTHSPFRVLYRTLLLGLLATPLLIPANALARNGDDWVLVERFQNQQHRAQAGDAAAMYELAHMYELGRGTPPDMNKAVQWYNQAIDKGQNNARAHLGVLYLEGRGLKINLAKAGNLLKAAATGGSATGQYYLGKMYEEGKGMRRDPGQASYWYKLAAKNGYYLAIARLKELENEPASSSTAGKRAKAVPVRKESPASILRQTVLNANWERNGQPLAFLPSSNAKCDKGSAKSVRCKSGQQKRSTGDAIITYTTDATIGSFNNSDEFTISYTNTVLKVKAVDRPSLNDEEQQPARRPPNIPLGKQSVVHKLHCELQTIDKLVCVKDNNRTDVYTRAKK